MDLRVQLLWDFALVVNLNLNRVVDEIESEMFPGNENENECYGKRKE